MIARDSVWIGPDSLRPHMVERNWSQLVRGPFRDKRGVWGIVRDAVTGVRSVVDLGKLDIVDFNNGGQRTRASDWRG